MICNAILKDGSKCKFIVYEMNGVKCKHHSKSICLEDLEKSKKRKKEKAKLYYIENKVKIDLINKQFYINNKYRYLKKIICDCGSQLSNMNIHAHSLTIKHKDYIKKNGQQIF